ncbi:MAG: triphosphoribosyl-dephospho-CoA synthase CitG [Flexilinea sp.]
MLNPEQISSFAMQSLLVELAVTPKPGLVDRNNSGAHRDMDFFTFQISAAALAIHFYHLAKIGYEFYGIPAELFSIIRKAGMDAERDMFAQTGGVNTHKGALFSLGLICAAAGYLCKSPKSTLPHTEICAFVKEMTNGLCERELVQLEVTERLTHGERMYLQYRVPGIRGEAESGFASVRIFVYPEMSRLLKENRHSLNDILAHGLLLIMANVVDTNVSSRHDMETVVYVQKCAQSVLEKGGCLTQEGIAAAKALDEDFIRKNISPGGCADLLAVSYYLYCLENHHE